MREGTTFSVGESGASRAPSPSVAPAAGPGRSDCGRSVATTDRVAQELTRTIVDDMHEVGWWPPTGRTNRAEPHEKPLLAASGADPRFPALDRRFPAVAANVLRRRVRRCDGGAGTTRRTSRAQWAMREEYPPKRRTTGRAGPPSPARTLRGYGQQNSARHSRQHEHSHRSRRTSGRAANASLQEAIAPRSQTPRPPARPPPVERVA
jgi:hypothetical protein